MTTTAGNQPRPDGSRISVDEARTPADGVAAPADDVHAAADGPQGTGSEAPGPVDDPQEPVGDSRGGDEGVVPDKAKPATPWWKETLLLVGTALILALIIKTFFMQAFYIPSGSMENTLQVNDRILVEKVSYWFGQPQRGDIIVFDDPANWLGEEDATQPSNPVTKALAFIGLYPEGGHLVKRVIGVGGDHVRCHRGFVQVNGVNLQESSYVTLAPQACTGSWSVIVPPDHLWVLGDNRDNSADSRVHIGDPGGGFIPNQDVVGKVFVTVWPIDRWRLFHRPSTFDNPALNRATGIVEDTVPLGSLIVLVPMLYRRSGLRYGEPDPADVGGDGQDPTALEPAGQGRQ
jgi:signal peptidase I